MSDYNPFDRYRHPFIQQQLDAKKLRGPANSGKPDAGIISRPSPDTRPVGVALPSHLFTPSNAEPVDIRMAADIAAGTLTPAFLMSFTCPKGALTHFISYGVFSDGILAANQEFIPKVNGNKVFQFQGDPNDNFKINLGLAPDLSNNSLIQCQLTLNPEETVEWTVINANIVDIAMAVRMVGYVDYVGRRVNAR